MKINSFSVSGFLGQEGTKTFTFHKDINIVTGRNGSGKTNLLRLLWYIISGNILIALKEVSFATASVNTDEYICTVIRTGEFSCKIEYYDYTTPQLFTDVGEFESAEDFANPILRVTGSSIFFPTFRRIEGGFTLDTVERKSRSAVRSQGEVEEALVSLSRRLTTQNHTFVSALSTSDIELLIFTNYSDLSQKANRHQQAVSQSVLGQIRTYNHTTPEDEAGARKLLNSIQSQIINMEKRWAEVMSPMESLQKWVQKLIRHSGVNVGKAITFGDTAKAIKSNKLSAGEKQLFSFIAYNAFCKDCIFIIDEPELSLHVDWQRELVPILQSQNSSNQFVMATHSPFIYAKYTDKEIELNVDKGEN